ncbi:MAG: M23 family metallopeptidase [Clostridia bacterium]|nr:M23 family metallopeptidase [Clostridia bacterium]MBR3152199.1 M23 family metallopeptidase [Clostridia bacterium]MBR3152264.1 M23 family metallopeptidase [Clostridia bacterium]
MKSIIIHLRKSIRLLLLIGLGAFIIAGILYFIYKPVYKVTLNGEVLGYIDDKSKLQDKINEYIRNGDSEDVAFVEFDTLPMYETCFSRKDNELEDSKILDEILATGTSYYKYYAIIEDTEEKYYVKNYDEAEEIINTLKEKNSTNIDQIKYEVRYNTEQKEFTAKDDIVAALYVEPVVVKPTVSYSTSSYTAYSSSGSVNTSQTVSYSYTPIGVSLIRPVGGTITSVYGPRSRGVHTGLDIATSSGTPIGAAASGTVSYAGWKGGYGNLLVIDHADGVQTYYAHCSALYVSAGTSVSQGETVAAIGSTGNSTGPHLHLEVRVGGICQNPQNYVY